MAAVRLSRTVLRYFTTALHAVGVASFATVLFDVSCYQ